VVKRESEPRIDCNSFYRRSGSANFGGAPIRLDCPKGKNNIDQGIAWVMATIWAAKALYGRQDRKRSHQSRSIAVQKLIAFDDLKNSEFVAPLQGLMSINPFPRALPWAVLYQPVGRQTSILRVALAG
jgi:hypothetical protein